jgi:vacuolar iron transporter family protein
MLLASSLWRVRRSLSASAGTIVFGMEDGTVSIFGLIFGVAATTSNAKTILIAGAADAAAAAVSMMAGAYLDVETTRDAIKASRASMAANQALDPTSSVGCWSRTSLPPRFRFCHSSWRRSLRHGSSRL